MTYIYLSAKLTKLDIFATFIDLILFAFFNNCFFVFLVFFKIITFFITIILACYILYYQIYKL